MAMYKIGKTLKSMKKEFFDTLSEAKEAKRKDDNIYRLMILPHDRIGWRKVK